MREGDPPLSFPPPASLPQLPTLTLYQADRPSGTVSRDQARPKPALRRDVQNIMHNTHRVSYSMMQNAHRVSHSMMHNTHRVSYSTLNVRYAYYAAQCLHRICSMVPVQ